MKDDSCVTGYAQRYRKRSLAEDSDLDSMQYADPNATPHIPLPPTEEPEKRSNKKVFHKSKERRLERPLASRFRSRANDLQVQIPMADTALARESLRRERERDEALRLLPSSSIPHLPKASSVQRQREALHVPSSGMEDELQNMCRPNAQKMKWVSGRLSSYTSTLYSSTSTELMGNSMGPNHEIRDTGIKNSFLIRANASASAASMQNAYSTSMNSASMDFTMPQFPCPQEFSIEDEINLSQDKLLDLSVQESQPLISLDLDTMLENSLNKDEKRLMKELGMISIPLSDMIEPFVIGRDNFRTVFGEKIRGAHTSLLSRKHCVFHVTSTWNNGSAGFEVTVQNTSTNGIEVNDKPVPAGESQPLSTGDVITLLRLPKLQDSPEVALRYTLRDSMIQKSVHGMEVGKYVVEELSITSTVSEKPQDRYLGGWSNTKIGSAISAGNRPASPCEQKAIPCTVVLADPIVMRDDAVHPSRDFKNEIMGVFSPLSISAFEGYNASNSRRADKKSLDAYQLSFAAATKSAIIQTLQSNSPFLILAGANENCVINDSGLQVEMDFLALRALYDASSVPPKLILVYSNSTALAEAFAECGAPHVIYVNSALQYVRRSAAFIRAIFAGMAQGFSVKKSYETARTVALNATQFDEAMLKQFSDLFQSNQTFSLTDHASFRNLRDKRYADLVQFLIPELPDHLVSRSKQIGEVIASLRSGTCRHCNLYGSQGIGKTTLATQIARYASRMDHRSANVLFISVKDYDKFICPDHNSAVADDTYDFNRAVINQLQHEIEHFYRTQGNMPSNEMESITGILVLDGCDCLVLCRIREFILHLLYQFPGIKILTTSRSKMESTDIVPSYEEQFVHIDRLSDTKSAMLLLASCNFPIPRESLRQSRLDWQSASMEALIASHPAVMRLEGNPMQILQLAHGMQSKLMDEFI